MAGPESRVSVGDDALARALAAARASMKSAHAPYSGFCVGAAVLTSAGAVHTGCNVESASFGLTLCAERAALAAWIDAGGRARGETVVAVAIATRAARPTPPCGACRQWIAELAPGAAVVAFAEPSPGGVAAGPGAGEGGRGGAESAPSLSGGGGGGGALPGRPDSVSATWRIEDLLPEAFGGADLTPRRPPGD